MTTLTIATTLATPAAADAHTNWSKLDRDIHAAINYSGHAWNVSPAWLHACVHSEGGHGRYIVNGHNAHGPFQFLPGTFTWMSAEAWKTAARNRMGRPPVAYRSIWSRLGQAWTAGWAFSRGYSHHWYGPGC